MNYNSVSCPKCGVSLSIDESVRGKRVACPSCGHQMVIPSYADETTDFNEKTFIEKFPKKNMNNNSGNVAQPQGKHFFFGVVLILVVLLFSLIVNILLLTTFVSMKRIYQAEAKKNSSLTANNALVSKTEYRVIRLNGKDNDLTDDSGEFEKKIENVVSVQGKDNWELSCIVPVVETTFSNISEDSLIPQYMSDTRTGGVVLIFKRDKGI